MTTLLSDTFTGADGTLLTAHIPDVGGPWTMLASTAKILSNHATNNVSNAFAKAVVDVAEADVLVAFEMFAKDANSNDMELIVRCTDVNNYVYLRWGRNTVQVARIVAGVVTAGVSHDWEGAPLAQGTQVTLSVETENDSLLVRRDGIEIMSTKVAAYALTGTKTGIGIKSTTALPCSFDNLAVSDVVSVGAFLADPGVTATDITGTFGSAKLWVPTGLTSFPLVMHCHGVGGTLADDAKYDLIRSALLNSGYGIVSGLAGGSLWGNTIQTGHEAAIITKVRLTYTCTDIHFLGESMGGISALNAIRNGGISGVKSWAGISPAVSIDAAYNVPALVSGIEGAYGFSGGAAQNAATDPFDPILAAGSTWAGLYMRAWADPADSTTPAALHALALQTAAGVNPAEFDVIYHSGGHVNTNAFRPVDYIEFLSRVADTIEPPTVGGWWW